MIELKSEPCSNTDKLADDALEELNGLGLEYGTHTVIGMALGKLKAYEGTGLTPEQVEELQVDYAVKGTLLAEYQSYYRWHKIADKDYPKIGEEVYCTDGKCCFLAGLDEIGVFIDSFGDPISVTKWRRLPADE